MFHISSLTARARQFDRPLHRLTQIKRSEFQLRRMGEIIDLSDDEIEPADFLHHDLVEIAPEIGVVEALGKQLGEGLDRDQRVAHFVRHASREVGPKGRTIDQLLLLPERFFRRHILNHRDRA